jgi:hypothetical protein
MEQVRKIHNMSFRHLGILLYQKMARWRKLILWIFRTCSLSAESDSNSVSFEVSMTDEFWPHSETFNSLKNLNISEKCSIWFSFSSWLNKFSKPVSPYIYNCFVVTEAHVQYSFICSCQWEDSDYTLHRECTDMCRSATHLSLIRNVY